MAGITPTAQLASLQSSDELGLLDVIDKLRSQGIGHYIQLPQLIVCGDQSSGKSSVLEAISGIPFPTKDSLCTRFPTEVILRKTQTVSGTVSIVPSQTRSQAECDRFALFKPSLTKFDELGAVMENANQLMGISSGASGAFSDDVLRVEITGPDQPQLTIVDLPGLIHSENKMQTADDVEMIQRMIRSYMGNRRSIIMAIVSAKNDLANQVVLNMAKKYDPKGMRTLGIITKPDTLPPGSESEMDFTSLARNENVDFRLGWHVVRNRSYEERDTTLEARELVEQEFFRRGVWADFPRIAVGIGSLRPRLSKILVDQIKTELPSVVSEIEGKLKDCQSKLEKLGPIRDTFERQQKFLLEISNSFQALSKAAIDGVYSDPFFVDAHCNEGYAKRIRAIVQNCNVDFSSHIQNNGHYWTIVHDHDSTDDGEDREDEGEDGEEDEGEDGEGNVEKPKTISRADMIEYTKDLLRRSRGPELPGMFNPMIVADLFRTQSTRWESLSRDHVANVWEKTLAFLEHMTRSLTDPVTSGNIYADIISPHMEGKLKQLNDKLTEILRVYSKSHPITYNHYFTENVQKSRNQRQKAEIEKQLMEFFGQSNSSHGLKKYDDLGSLHTSGLRISDLLARLTERTEADMDRYACSELLDCMDAYYKVAMKTMVDNVCTLTIEAILASGLENIFSPSTVIQMNSNTISRIGAELPENSVQREELSRQFVALKSGLDACKAYLGRGILGHKSLKIEDDALIPDETPNSAQTPMSSTFEA